MTTEEYIDELVLKLACYDAFALPGKSEDRALPVDRNQPEKRPSFPQPSPMGQMDALPLELLHEILEQCDLLSLTRVARTCKCGREAVEALRPYRLVMQTAYPTMNLLSQIHLAGWHTIADIYAALRSRNCVTCGNFGVFVFAPTLDRLCLGCTHNNQLFWLLPADRIGSLFGLSSDQFQSVPTIYGFPGNSLNRYKRAWLCPVKNTRDIALKVHGSKENLLKYVEESGQVTNIEFIRYLVEGPVPQPWMFAVPPTNVFDRYRRQGSVLFPCLMPDRTIETGVWCKGCQNSYVRRTNLRSDEEVDALSPPGVSTYRTTYFFGNTARTMADFREHVQTCPMAKRLLDEWKEQGQSANAARLLVGAFTRWAWNHERRKLK